MTNFCVMICAMASGEAKLPGMTAGLFFALTTGVFSAMSLHF